MKRFCLLLVSAGLLILPETMQAQEERRAPRMSRSSEQRNRQQANNDNSGLPELTVRAQNMNELLTQEIGDARWMRIIYRELDMLKDKNAPLYYPVTPVNGSMNLFTTLFQLAGEGKLPIYEYLGDYEAFDEAHLAKFKDVLDRFYILYETIPGGRGGQERYVIRESDVPSQEVRAYYIKEAWYFDQNNSVYDVKILAVCPIIFLNADFGEQRSPMFWVPYEALRPYVSNTYIMTSNLNNAKTFTIDDYFRRRMFEGEIIKTENLLNIPLQAYCPTPDSMQREQERIESELAAFEKALWFQPDSAQLASAATGKKSSGKSSKATSSSKKKSKEKTSTQKKAASPKPEKSTPTRSVRRR